MVEFEGEDHFSYPKVEEKHKVVSDDDDVDGVGHLPSFHLGGGGSSSVVAATVTHKWMVVFVFAVAAARIGV